MRALKDLILFPPSYYKMMEFDLRTEATAESIDPNEKSVRIETAAGDQEGGILDTFHKL